MSLKIGVTTLGGDCPGLNTCIRSIVLSAEKIMDAKIFGLKNIENVCSYNPENFINLSEVKQWDIYLRTAGTILGGVTKTKIREDEGDELLFKTYKELELDVIIAIGGDGSISMLSRVIKKFDINIIAIPKTIDNDVFATDLSIGYVTSVETVMSAIDSLCATASSHGRVMVLEVMGRDSGSLALMGGIAGGADVILIPEASYELEKVYEKIVLSHKRNRYAIVVVSESVAKADGNKITIDYGDMKVHYGGIGQYIGSKIMENTSLETRVNVLGHMQRGQSPIAVDRVLASSFGVYAVDLVKKNMKNKMIILKDGALNNIDLLNFNNDNNNLVKTKSLMNVAQSLGIYVGQIK